MSVSAEIRQKIKSRMAEILLAHGRKMTPQVKEEIAKNVLKILQEHGIDIPVEKLPQWVVDPVGRRPCLGVRRRDPEGHRQDLDRRSAATYARSFDG